MIAHSKRNRKAPAGRPMPRTQHAQKTKGPNLAARAFCTRSAGECGTRLRLIYLCAIQAARALSTISTQACTRPCSGLIASFVAENMISLSFVICPT
jgi:hypothetical protein